ncbi:MAG TPA: 50S ribosomal protein L10 [Pirellulaceae bacterium]|nr:50S ribosomal protein L10 [Pirellulaceae bacterium]HMO92482.1 50S ribosomal protein L10 [Pirellulaceae bacterium]HMP67848.1 50S ribosomal protein L10 [Pirellulaceae bacterium]
MSKLVKNLITEELQRRLKGVENCVVANVVGLNSDQTAALRSELRKKSIRVIVVKNSLARRATEGTPLNPAFQGLNGPAAVLWGCEDFVSLVKEVTAIDKSGAYPKFEPRGGAMDGEPLTANRVREISKWPNRAEQLSILSGQLLSPGAKLASQIIGPGGQLASQISTKAEE